MSQRWRQFWEHYRSSPARTEADLFVQVGKTVDRAPIAPAVFAGMLAQVVEGLDLRPGDHLADLCCGNGLVTRALAGKVERITAVDFAEHLIDEARRWTDAANVRYHVADIEDGLRLFEDDPPDKVLVNDSLGYFTPASFGRVLDALHTLTGHRPLRLLATGIPDHARRFAFYDTPERRARFLEEEARGDDTHQGMGRWWQAAELEALGRERGWRVRVEPQPAALSHYRSNAVFELGG